MPDKQIVVKKDQSVLDIALQYYGSLSGMFDIATRNNLSITDGLSPGQTLFISGAVNETTRYIAAKGYLIATADYDAESEQTGLIGIGYWKIGQDFKVQ